MKIMAKHRKQKQAEQSGKGAAAEDPHAVLRHPANPPRANLIALLLALAAFFAWFVYLVYVAVYG